ncbi:hypothetical protein GCM10011575_28860 [Microlunatus endophyticus]|uniref:Uncharacterized protein n=1 Tax=Microlunatus endophyticus TaxID=1716077 RepID=A0A917W4T5_9ACTN|nr:hypothetical protein GCM10011575_28860 [Microlunatus endophyticus]
MLNRADPEGLLSIGAPADEYESEADDLARRLRDGRVVSPGLFREVWELWFGPDSSYLWDTAHSRVDELAAEVEALR